MADLITIADKSTGDTFSAAELNQILDALKDGTKSILTESLSLTSLTAAPSSPAAGEIYRADGNTWDPASLSIAKSYFVVYTGSAYVALRDTDGKVYGSYGNYKLLYTNGSGVIQEYDLSANSDEYIKVAADGHSITSVAGADMVDGIEVILDGGGSALTDGTKIFIEVPFACTITEARLLADQSGSVKVDWWKDTYANYPPTSADTITASATPEISSAAKYSDATLSGWTTSIAAGDILCAAIDGNATTITQVTAVLKVTR